MGSEHFGNYNHYALLFQAAPPGIFDGFNFRINSSWS